MKRNTQSNDDSLELLLDTICNVFGGIVFIAILVALLTSAKAKSVREQQDQHLPAMQAKLQADQLQAQIQSMRAGLEQLEQTRIALDRSQVVQTVEVIDEINAANQQADNQISTLRQWIDQFDSLDSTVADQAETRLQRAFDDVQLLRNALDKATAQGQIQGRLPQSRITRKTQVIFLLQGQRIYWVPTKSARQVIGTQREGDVNVKQNLLGSITVTPKADGGFTVDGKAGNNAELQNILRAMKPDQHFFDFYVAEDSVAVFQQIKSLIAAAGFDYNATPTSSAKSHVFGSTNTLHTQ